MGERVLGGHCFSLSYVGLGLSLLGQPHVLAPVGTKARTYLFEAGFLSHKEN